jgi:four helix bundle protein
MTYQDVEDLPVWKNAIVIAKQINALTSKAVFAKDFSLKDQMRRAAVSVGSNIAEGFERGSNREFIRFLRYAKGSATEVRTQLVIAFDLQYLDSEQYQHLHNQLKALAISLGKFIVYLKKRS